MKLNFLINKETSLIIEDVDKSIAENGFLGSCYQKAIDTLKIYTEQTKQIRKTLYSDKLSESGINNELYRSPQNIIAFSGKRGTGKTSTMLSFAEFLEKKNSDKKKEIFPHNEALVLNPIDPTMLATGQNILSVVLSRLLYRAEEHWNHHVSFDHSYRNLENEKNTILKKADACLKGINAIKSNREINDLSALQRMGDSATLKKDFFELVDCVTSFCLNSEASNNRIGYLVIPIDDTDCQILSAHSVMEDIRRYLTLPNVIILMATDSDMLRTVFSQHFAGAFNYSLNQALLNSNDMQHYAEKYMSKLIPTNHKIYLPTFEEIIREKSDVLHLGYYEDEKENLDLISGTTIEQRKEFDPSDGSILDFDFQAKVLTYIYMRTGIAFTEHMYYVHNIIPTTVRGLAHLLNHLCSMSKVEEINKEDYAKPDRFIELINKQINTLENNLDMFEKYFMKEWVTAKLSASKADVIKGITEQVPGNRIHYAAVESLREYGNDSAAGKNEITYSYYDLMDILGSINGTIDTELGALKKPSRKMEDYYYTYAVKAIITIKNNKRALKAKRRAVEKYKANHDKRSFNYDIFNGNRNESFPGPQKVDLTYRRTPYYESLLRPFVEYIQSILKEAQSKENITLEQVYKLQEFAKTVICNSDVMEMIGKFEKKELTEKGKFDETSAHRLIDHILNNNCCMLKKTVDNDLIELVHDLEGSALKNLSDELISSQIAQGGTGKGTKGNSIGNAKLLEVLLANGSILQKDEKQFYAELINLIEKYSNSDEPIDENDKKQVKENPETGEKKEN